MSKSFLIDTTLCTACRGCQVACKQWHDLPAEVTTNRGTYQNPDDLSFSTYKLVRMKEEIIGGSVRWLFFPDQCRHCVEPPCQDTAGDPSAVFTDPGSGAVIYTANTKALAVDDVIESCPYDIPRKSSDGTLAKCDMCLDRVQNGLQPACVQTCPTGTMNFGDRDQIRNLAQMHLAEAKKKFPKAQLLDADDVRVIYLTAYEPQKYHENAVAAEGTYDITRQMALQRLLRPVKDFMTHIL